MDQWFLLAHKYFFSNSRFQKATKIRLPKLRILAVPRFGDLGQQLVTLERGWQLEEGLAMVLQLFSSTKLRRIGISALLSRQLPSMLRERGDWALTKNCLATWHPKSFFSNCLIYHRWLGYQEDGKPGIYWLTLFLWPCCCSLKSRSSPSWWEVHDLRAAFFVEITRSCSKDLLL